MYVALLSTPLSVAAYTASSKLQCQNAKKVHWRAGLLNIEYTHNAMHTTFESATHTLFDSDFFSRDTFPIVLNREMLLI